MKLSSCILVSALAAAAFAAESPRVIRLYTGAAPGSESWTHQEKEYFSPIWNTQVVTNVVNPTLTVFTPAAGTANGTAVVVCPGGGFHALSINSEGVDVAKWLAAKGVTAFVLKYRLVPTGEDGVQEVMTKIANRAKLDSDNAAVIPLAQADGRAAVAYVRKHAAEFGIIPDRAGIIGFSAGGTVTMSAALDYTPESRPAFAAPIYAYTGALPNTTVPSDAPPLFIAAASDDQLGLAPDSIKLWTLWTQARKPAELHIYERGGHGFGMRRQGLNSDTWIDRFGEWLAQRGWLKR